MGFGFGDVFSGIKDVFSPVFNGIKSVGEGVYGSVLKPLGEKAWGFASKGLDRIDRLGNLGDKVIDTSGQIVGGAGNLAEGIGNLFNSNILITLGLVGAGLIILPKVLDRVM